MWIIILSLLLIGLALIIVEVVFVPGTTVVGVIGVIFAGAGIIITFRQYGSETGWYILVGMSVITAVALFFAFRSDAWMRFANKSAISSKVNEGTTVGLQVGDEGTTLSVLRPMGTAEFNGSKFEVKTLGDYIDAGTRVTIVHLSPHEIIVKPLN